MHYILPKIALFFALLAGCGQMGPLYYPEESAAPEQAPEQVPNPGPSPSP
jgi:predicted small lipoprotein YifL